MRKVVVGFIFIFVRRAERSPAFPSWKLVRFSRQIRSPLSAVIVTPYSHLAAGARYGRHMQDERSDAPSPIAALCAAQPDSVLSVSLAEH